MISCISVKQMQAADQYTCRHLIPSRELVRRAGEAVFELIKDKGDSFALLCGKGNNGADGYVIALALWDMGKKCRIFLEKEAFSPDSEHYFSLCREKGIPFELWSADSSLADFDCIIDCIYGIGFHGRVISRARDMIEAANALSAYKISVDINSGLSGESGMGELFFKSDLTVAIGHYKYGHFLADAADAMKSRAVVDIGIPLTSDCVPCYVAQDWDFSSVLPQRKRNCHKGDFGYVTVMGGSPCYSGAVKLANLSLSALKSGCGVSRLACAESLTHSVSPYLLESTLFPVPDEKGDMIFCPEVLDKIIASSKAIALGMGWGQGSDNGKILSFFLEEYSGTLIIDADGINTLSALDRELIRKAKCSVILTPHPKEFSRLCGKSVEQILSDPVGHAKEYAAETGSILLLKGCATVVTDGKETVICTKGCAGMASAGSGDLLSGVLAGIHGYNAPRVDSVACASYLCGLAGEMAQEKSGDIGMTASDTLAKIPEATHYLQKCGQHHLNQ